MPAVKQQNVKTKEEILASKDEFHSAMETLRRLARITGKQINEPSGIVRRSSRGQWLAKPKSHESLSAYSPCACGHGKEK